MAPMVAFLLRHFGPRPTSDTLARAQPPPLQELAPVIDFLRLHLRLATPTLHVDTLPHEPLSELEEASAEVM